MMLNIIVDLSGSMAEHGKAALIMNLIRATRAVIPNRKLFAWRETVSEGIRASDRPHGSADNGALRDFIETNGAGRYLILSDGNFGLGSDRAKLGGDGVLTRVVAVGPDADVAALRKLATDGIVRAAEDIVSAAESAMFGSDDAPAPPASAVGLAVPGDTV